jgi:EAL domain-containing protein (putative c-di-GMP-specific phosphodiesterase class I)
MTKSQQSKRAPIEIASALSASVANENGKAADILNKLLHAVRIHFGMEAAFVSKFEHGRRVFQAVDSVGGKCALPVGASDPLEESYCQRIADGRLPELMPNAQDVPAAHELAATREFPVGAHLSIPMRLSDGSIYGTFCCFSRTPDYTLNPRDIELMRTFADIASSVLERDPVDAERDAESRERVESVLRGDGLTMVYQPIVDLESELIVGFESLARFSSLPPRTPDLWFEEASRLGLGDELEARAIECALERGSPNNDVYVACNVSPEVVLNGHLPLALSEGALSRIVLEITEHSIVADYEKLEYALRPLRARGMRVSVDDAGAGHSSFRHILRLRPEFIKLDISLTRDIDTDGARRALAAALIGFTRETGSELIAEGIETPAELATLRALGVHKGQGYLLGRPAPFDAARQMVESRYAS